MITVAVAAFALIGYIGCWQYFKTLPASGPKTIWPIVGVMVPVVGVFVGWKFFILGGARRPSREEIRQANAGKLSDVSLEKLLDIIDNTSSAALAATNSAWLQNNWHNMQYPEKIEWVKQRETQLKDHLCGAVDDFGFIQAMQDADKDYLRQELRLKRA